MRNRRMELKEYSKVNNISGEGEKNLSTQNVSLWHENLGRLFLRNRRLNKCFVFTSSLTVQKNLDREPAPKVSYLQT